MQEDRAILRELNRQVFITLAFINFALAFSVALPAAGMVNHLLPFGEPLFWRGLLIWALLTLVCITLSFLLIPWVRRRLETRMQRQLPQREIKAEN